MEIKENISLAPYTTLHIGGPARYFIEVCNEQELSEGLAFAKAKPSDEMDEKGMPVFILGGGSNVLFSDNGFEGLVIRSLVKGRELLSDSDSYVRLRVGAGEVLDEVIAWTVDHGWWGIENLSFIPGLVAGLAIQNVGAYGQEASEVIESVEVMDLMNYELQIINNKECKFTYRQSTFNTDNKGRYVIVRINLRLKKLGRPNLEYKDLKEYFASLRVQTPKLMQVRDAVIEIRRGKGQDPDEIWSAGSFFKNFVVSDGVLDYKISAGEILDKRLGLKGLQVGGAKLSEKQVLNLVNVGDATAQDCIQLFNKVRDLVRDNTGLKLINEPEFVGF